VPGRKSDHEKKGTEKDRDRKLNCTESIAFGPVVSRRLGQSLGVNTVPCKTCAYSCIYCQLGPTQGRTVNRQIHYEAETVAEAVRATLDRSRTPPDFVTFLGCGEPTLAANLGESLKAVKRVWGGRTALITSGALFSKPDVREEAMAFDTVMPTVAAGNDTIFRRLHHPHPRIAFEDVVSGLTVFSERYDGRFIPEVMLVGEMNDSVERFEEIKDVLRTMDVHEVHLTAPVRPPTQTSVRPPTREAVAQAMRILPGAVDFTSPEREAVTEVMNIQVGELLAIASMHPLTEEQALSTLEDAGASEERGRALLSGLVESSKMVRTEYGGKRYYRTRT